jgi:metal-sulfur cluster biosynthetic enzyme
MIDKTIIEQALKQVIDPELGINMVDLGLLYDIQLNNQNSKLNSVEVIMTLTTPGCPLGGYFVDRVTEVTAEAAGIEPEQVVVRMVWDPPWNPGLITLEAQAALGFD